MLCAYMNFSKLPQEDSDPAKQLYFDLEGIDFEKAYAEIELEHRLKEEFGEEEGEERFSSIFLHAETGLDQDYIDSAWKDLVSAQRSFNEIPRLRQSIENAMQEWQNQLRKPIPLYEDYLQEKYVCLEDAFLKVAKPETIARLNQAVREFNALSPEEKAEKWSQYFIKTRMILDDTLPHFISVRGCRNCETAKELQERGFNHETLARCLIYGCKTYGHDAAAPFIDPEDVLKEAIKANNPEAAKNARRYIASVKAMYDTCYEAIGVCLDSMLEKLTGQTSQPREQT